MNLLRQRFAYKRRSPEARSLHFTYKGLSPQARSLHFTYKALSPQARSLHFTYKRLSLCFRSSGQLADPKKITPKVPLHTPGTEVLSVSTGNASFQ